MVPAPVNRTLNSRMPPFFVYALLLVRFDIFLASA